ncbi:MAG: hypothetical protein A3H35_01720 [Betaproteobacteria bacterium RIFCSPLOWO2_02_FULL_62_17]|nr:MAG: hypothetical protein A3H35_01720 [Betaproteobacteria bacterium RIFCSPLOWO2_02_FULL_62_17]
MGLFSLTCKQASRLQSQALDRELRLSERLALGFHLGLCDACRKISMQMDFLRRAARAYRVSDDDSGN